MIDGDRAQEAEAAASVLPSSRENALAWELAKLVVSLERRVSDLEEVVNELDEREAARV